VNFNADVIIWLKGVSSLHLQVSFSNIYVTWWVKYKTNFGFLSHYEGHIFTKGGIKQKTYLKN